MTEELVGAALLIVIVTCIVLIVWKGVLEEAKARARNKSTADKYRKHWESSRATEYSNNKKSEPDKYREYEVASKQAYDNEVNLRKPKHEAEFAEFKEKTARTAAYFAARKATKDAKRREKEAIDMHRAEDAKRREKEAIDMLRAKDARRREKVRLNEQAKAISKELEEQAKAISKELEEQAKAAAAEQLAQRFTTLKSNLPFYTSNRTPSAELADHDKKEWDKVTKLVQAQDSKQATLYFVRMKSLLDNKEYYKIGITTAGVNTRFQKSTQVELLETVCTFDTELWKAAYLEYHFLREFRLYDGLADSLGELRPNVGFSGYTEVVRSNSVNKIAEFFGQLDVYNTPN
jgi:hypothetical protein